MHKRTNLVLAFLENDISVFIGEVDQVWLVDPLRYIEVNLQGTAKSIIRFNAHQ